MVGKLVASWVGISTTLGNLWKSLRKFGITETVFLILLEYLLQWCYTRVPQQTVKKIWTILSGSKVALRIAYEIVSRAEESAGKSLPIEPPDIRLGTHI
jgi:hypothetical protein